MGEGQSHAQFQDARLCRLAAGASYKGLVTSWVVWQARGVLPWF